MGRIRKAVIPVAGLGTRFLPATKALPKELLPIVDKPVIQFIVEEAVASGIEQIVFITSENKVAIENYFDRDSALECVLSQKNKTKELASIQGLAQMAEFIYIRQQEPLGLGHAVLQAKDVIGDEPFLVFGGDDIVESEVPAARQLIDVYDQHHGAVIGVMNVPQQSVHRYGIIECAEELPDGVARLSGIIEKPSSEGAPSTLAVGGRWLLTPDIFSLLEKTQPGSGGEIQLTDAICALIQAQPVYSKTYEGIYRDCGNKLEYIKAVLAFAVQRSDIGPALKAYIHEL